MENVDDSVDGFGSASIEQEFDGFKIFKLKTPDEKKQETITELIVRLLPPMHSLKADPTGWRRYYGNHYGHYGNNSRSPEKPRPRPFGCIQEKNFKTKEIKVACPKCDQIEVVRGKQNKRKAEIEAANPHIAKIENEKDREKASRELCKPDKTYATYSEWLRKHNCDRKWWINVMAKDGSFGVLQLSHDTFKNKLEPKLKEWRDNKKLDVFHPLKGTWLRFTRTGRNPRVTDSVELLTETVEREGETLDKTVMSPLTKEQILRALKICPDLATGCVTILPVDKIKALIESKGDLDKVDEIWDGPKAAGSAGSDRVTSSTSLEDSLDDADDITTTVETKTTVAATKATTSLDDDEAALEAKLNAMRERKAQEAIKTTVAAATATEVAESPEDFLENFSAS